MATKQELKAAHQRILSRPPAEGKSDQELLRKTEDDGVYPSTLNVKTIRLDRIVPDPGRLPRTYSAQSLAELGQSLLAHGQLVPITVQYLSDDDVFVLVDGERRWRAAQKTGLKTLQAVIVSPLTALDSYERQGVTVLHQARWDAAEWLHFLESYKKMQGLATWAQVAEHLGVSEGTLNALLHASLAESGKMAEDVLGQANAILDLLDRALGRLQPDGKDSAGIAELLNRLAGCVAQHRERLLYGRAKRQPPEPGTPMQHMPTWGQG